MAGAVVGGICGFFLLALALFVYYLYSRPPRLSRPIPRSRLEDLSQPAPTSYYEYLAAIVPRRYPDPPPLREPRSPITLDRPFYELGGSTGWLLEQAENLSKAVQISDSWVLDEPLSSVDAARITKTIREFGPVPGQLPTERLLELLQQDRNRLNAMDHFISTTLISSIILESQHLQLLAAPVAYFLRYVNLEYPMFRESRHGRRDV